MVSRWDSTPQARALRRVRGLEHNRRACPDLASLLQSNEGAPLIADVVACARAGQQIRLKDRPKDA